MNAVLITIGDEILSGNTVDTNSNFIASELKNIGIPVKLIFTISDEIETIKETLKAAFSLGNLVITTGGLGPTKDDKTKTAFAQFFEDEIILCNETYTHLKNLLEKRNRAYLLDINKNQAEVLSTATVIQNDNGTAPCQMIEKDGRMAFCLPGVPYEVKPLIRNKIIPILAEKFKLNHIASRIISVVDIPESLLSKTIEDWELALPENVTLSYLPVGNRIKLRLTAVGTDAELLETQLNKQSEKLKPYIAQNVIAWDGNDIQSILKEILIQKKLTLSTAESCTGGELVRLLTSVSGSSEYFLGGIIPYDYHKKIEILGVSGETIAEKTVVSEEVAKQMAEGCQKLFRTDIALSTTGVAGPNSDEFNNRVGTVFYTVRVKRYSITNRLYLPHFDRGDFVNFVSQLVLQDLVDVLVNHDYEGSAK